MANIEKEIADAVLRSGGMDASGLGLRFDRVAMRVLGDLRAFVETAAPGGMSVLVTISAPIRLPAKTVSDLKREIGALLSPGVAGAEQSGTYQGNSVRIRLIEYSASGAAQLVGFVHNAASPPMQLLELAEAWVRARQESA